MKIDLALADARPIAEKLLRALATTGAVSRGEIVGSIRRWKPIVGDVELLLEPTPEYSGENGLGPVLEQLGIARAPPQNGRRRPWASRYYCGCVPVRAEGATEEVVQVDAFVVLPPARWGLLKLIWTGDAQFSQAFVTRLHRYGLRSEEGRIVRPGVGDGLRVDTPMPSDTERECFEAAHLPFIEPKRRYWTLEETRRMVLGA